MFSLDSLLLPRRIIPKGDVADLRVAETAAAELEARRPGDRTRSDHHRREHGEPLVDKPLVRQRPRKRETSVAFGAPSANTCAFLGSRPLFDTTTRTRSSFLFWWQRSDGLSRRMVSAPTMIASTSLRIKPVIRRDPADEIHFALPLQSHVLPSRDIAIFTTTYGSPVDTCLANGAMIFRAEETAVCRQSSSSSFVPLFIVALSCAQHSHDTPRLARTRVA